MSAAAASATSARAAMLWVGASIGQKPSARPAWWTAKQTSQAVPVM
jgi:hypothetical protein